MTELSVAELQAQLAKRERDLLEEQVGLRVAIKDQGDAARKIGSCQRAIRRIQWEIQKTKDLLTIAAIVIPEELITQRNELWAKGERVQRKDITVGEQEALTNEIEGLTKKLQERCPHPFVVGYRGDPGDEYNEREGSYRGHRTCLVCNYDEESSSSSEDAYTVLIEKEGRIIKSVEKDAPRIHEPSLEKIREMFIAAAG